MRICLEFCQRLSKIKFFQIPCKHITLHLSHKHTHARKLNSNCIWLPVKSSGKYMVLQQQSVITNIHAKEMRGNLSATKLR